jgi:hypothetical protein
MPSNSSDGNFWSRQIFRLASWQHVFFGQDLDGGGKEEMKPKVLIQNNCTALKGGKKNIKGAVLRRNCAPQLLPIKFFLLHFKKLNFCTIL